MLPPCVLSGRCPILEATFRQPGFSKLGGFEGISTFIPELLNSKELANKKPRYIRSLSHYSHQFAKATGDLPPENYTVAIIESWIARFESAHTRQTWLNRLSTFFGFLFRREKIPGNPCDKIERITIDQKTPATFDPSQLEKALHFTRREFPRFLRWLALASFCGTRPEETDKIEPRMIELHNRRIVLTSDITKDRRPRTVPIPDCAMEWLKFGGDLPLPLISRSRYIRRIRNHLGLEDWPQDVLRHTAASMMLAKHQDAGKVATWLGNSPKILLSRYITIPEPWKVEAFYNLYPFPKEPANVPSTV